MIRPWYRSRLFWFGVPGLVFLLWGWLAFPMRGIHLRASLGEYHLRFTDRSRVAVVSWEIYGRGRLMAPGFRADTFRLGPQRTPWGTVISEDPEVIRDRDWFPPTIRYDVWEGEYHLGTRRIPWVRVAYWFLLLIYLAAWGALLAGWQRRKSRLQKAAAVLLP